MIKFMSLEKGKVHPSTEQDDGTWRSLCGKTIFKEEDNPITWIIKKGNGLAYIYSPIAKHVGEPCGFKSCKEFFNSCSSVQENEQTLKTMEA